MVSFGLEQTLALERKREKGKKRRRKIDAVESKLDPNNLFVVLNATGSMSTMSMTMSMTMPMLKFIFIFIFIKAWNNLWKLWNYWTMEQVEQLKYNPGGNSGKYALWNASMHIIVSSIWFCFVFIFILICICISYNLLAVHYYFSCSLVSDYLLFICSFFLFKMIFCFQYFDV